MDNNEKDILNEVEGIINSTYEEYSTGHKLEALHIFSEMCKTFDQELPSDIETALFGVTFPDDDEKDEILNNAKEHPERTVVSQFADTSKGLDDPDLRAAKCQSVIHSIPKDHFMDMLMDNETSMLLSAWLAPQALISRVKDNGNTLQVMVTQNSIVFIKTLPTGDTVTKYWGMGEPKDSKGKTVFPERKDFTESLEYELVRGTYRYLCMPLELKEKSEQAYELLLETISENIQRKIQEGDED